MNLVLKRLQESLDWIWYSHIWFYFDRGDLEFESYNIVHESTGMSFGWCFIIYLAYWKTCSSLTIFSIMNVIWNMNIFLRITEYYWYPYLAVMWVDEMSCRKGVWKFDTLWEYPWIRVKRHVIHHWLYSLCTEDTWKVTARSHGRLVENTLLIAEGILYVTNLYHNILLASDPSFCDIRMMSLIRSILIVKY